MTTRGTGEDLRRVNLMLSRANEDFLVQLGREIDARTGAKVSRSEIIRASLAGMRELHRFSPLATCKNELDLTIRIILAVRAASTLAEKTKGI